MPHHDMTPRPTSVPIARPGFRLGRWLAAACAMGASLTPLHAALAAECAPAAPAAPVKGAKGAGATAGAAAQHSSAPSSDNISELTFAGLQKATALMSQKKTDEAIDKLKELTTRGTDYDKAFIYYNLGAIYAGKNDYGNATEYFTKSLTYNALPKETADQTQYMLGQIYIANNQYDQGIAALKTYFDTTCNVITPDQRMFLASAMAERKRYTEALEQTNLALAQAKEPKESWVQFKLGIQYEMKDFQACTDTLIQLIAMVPSKPDYWKQLSGVLLQLNDEGKATAVLALADRQGMLDKPEDIQNLYSTYMMLGEPLKAAQLIDTSIANNKMPSNEATLELVSNAWINARESEKAEDTLKKLAAMSDRGEYYFRLGAMYGDQERWNDSKGMLEHALEKGGLKRPGEAYFRIAVADYRSEDIKGAMTMLQKAATYDETKQQASEWMRVLQPQQASGAPTAAAPAPANGKS